jgi:hypothetical protein
MFANKPMVRRCIQKQGATSQQKEVAAQEIYTCGNVIPVFFV